MRHEYSGWKFDLEENVSKYLELDPNAFMPLINLVEE